MPRPTKSTMYAVLLAAGVAVVACNPTSIGEPRSPRSLSVQSGAVAASAKASFAAYAANGDLIHKKDVDAMDVDELAAREYTRDMRTTRAISAAMQSHGGAVHNLRRERPKALVSRLATRLSVAATDKQQLMDPTGHATLRFKSPDGHTIELERFGQAGSPDTLTTLRQDGVTVASMTTSWIRVTDGWVAQRVRHHIPIERGGMVEATLELSDWSESENRVDEASAGATRVMSSAAFCTAEDIEEGDCVWWDDDGGGGGGYIDQAEYQLRCSVFRFAAMLADVNASIAYNNWQGFHFEVHEPGCDMGGPYWVSAAICSGVTATCLAFFQAYTTLDANAIRCWQIYNAAGCGSW